MIKKKFKIGDNVKKNKLYITVIVFDTYLQMQEYKKNDWNEDENEDDNIKNQAYFKSLFFTRFEKGKYKVRNKIGEILFNKEKISYDIISHEALHSIFEFLQRIGIDNIDTKNMKLEEEICTVHQILYFNILVWLTANKIKLNKSIKRIK